MGMVIWEERAMSKRTRNTIKILFLVCWRIFFDYGFGNAPISKTGNISLIGIVISCIFMAGFWGLVIKNSDSKIEIFLGVALTAIMIIGCIFV